MKIRNIYKCKKYKPSKNLNKTCDNKTRCKIYYDEVCREYEEKENEELKKLKCKFKEYCTCDIEKYCSVLEEIREILMCKIYGLNENASQLDYMCYVLDKFEKIRIKILTIINEVLK